MKQLILAIALATASLPAATLNFACLTNNSGTCSTVVAPAFQVGVNDLGGGIVQFLFSNSLASTGRITTAYIDEGTSTNWFSSFSITSTPGTLFTTITSGTLPGGNSAPFSFSTDHGANRSGGSANGVDPGQTLDLRGTLSGSLTYANLIAGLATSTTDTAGLRVGLHVQALPNDKSEGLITTGVSPVPEPGTYGLLGASLASLAALKVRRAKR